VHDRADDGLEDGRVFAGKFDTSAAGEYDGNVSWRRVARRLLDEAGWTDSDGDGVRERDGVPFAFELAFPAGPQEIADRMAGKPLRNQENGKARIAAATR